MLEVQEAPDGLFDPSMSLQLAVKKVPFELQIEINCLKSSEEDLRNSHKVTVIVNINEYKPNSGLIFLFHFSSCLCC